MLQSKIILFLISLILVPAFLTAEEEGREKTNSIIGYGDALVLGLVEGITEFLPISSTGHLILVKEQIMDPSSMDASQEEAVDAYLIVIQAGAILAVALLYARRISTILLGFLGLDPKGKKLGINILAAFAPAAALGPFLDSWIESYLFGSSPCGNLINFRCGINALGREAKANFRWGRPWQRKKLERTEYSKLLGCWPVTVCCNVPGNESFNDDNCGRIFGRAFSWASC